jgi:tetratricopeptide (TPR) repeat protein
VDRALQRAMAKAPDARFPDMRAFAAALGAGPRTSRRGGLLVLGALLAAALALVARGRRPAPTAPVPAGDAIAVLPFTVQGADSLGLGPGMGSLFAAKLDGADGLRSVDPRALLGHVGQAERGPLDPAAGARVARRFGARFYVLGELRDLGGRLRVSAALYDVERAEPLATTASEGATGELFVLADSLAGRLLAARGTTFPVSSLAAFGTASLPALRAFLEGERAMRAGDFEAATEGYRRAVAADSTFALAWYRMSEAGEYLLREEIATSAAAQAERWGTRLPERERSLLAARLAARRGEMARAAGLLEGIVQRRPDDVEAWVQLAELRFHDGPRRGEPISRAAEAWRRAGELDPGHAAPALHLGRLAAMEGRREALDSLLGVLRRLTGGQGRSAREQYVEDRVLRAFVFGDGAERAARVEELRGVSELSQILALWNVAVFGGNLSGAVALGEELASPLHSARVRTLALGALGWLHAGEGRWAEAHRDLERLAELDPRLAVQYGAMIDLLPFRPVPSAVVAAWAPRVAALDTSTAAPDEVSSWFAPHRTLHRHVRLYLQALVAARTGKPGELAGAAVALARDTAASADAVPSDLALGLRAEALLQRGDSAAAARLLDGLQIRAFYQNAVTSPVVNVTRERWQHAEALAGAGRREEALRWFLSFEHHSIHDLAYAAPATLRRGELLEAMGRRAEAAAAYRRMLELWADCDPEGLALRARAEAGLQRVEAPGAQAPGMSPSR